MFSSVPRIFGVLLACFLLFSTATAQDSDSQNEQKVIDRFETLLERSPRRGTAFDRVYGFHTDHGQLDQFVQRLLEKEPEPAWTLAGLIRLRQGRQREAVEYLEKAVALDRRNFLPAMYLGEIFFRQDRLGEAAEHLENALARMTETADTEVDPKTENGGRTTSKDLLSTLQLLGRTYERLADRERAGRIWGLLERYFSDDPEILLQAAEAIEEENKLDEALLRYRRIEESARNDEAIKYRARLAAGNILLRLRRTDEAIECFENLLDRLSPESWQADVVRDRIEHAFQRERNENDLIEYYRKRRERKPDDPETVRRLAVRLRRLGRTEEARKILETAIRDFPSNIPLRTVSAEISVSEKRFADAVGRYAEIDRLAPNDADNLARWAGAVLNDTELDPETRKSRASSILKRLLGSDADDIAKIVTVAGMLNRAGLAGEAEKLYRRAAELDPGDPGRWEALAHFYREQGRREEAVETLRKTLPEENPTVTDMVRLGDIFRSLGYSDEAEKMYRKIVREEPDRFEYRMRYADWLLEKRKFVDAEREFAEAENLAEPLSERFRRVISRQLACFQASGRLSAELETLQNTVTETPAVAVLWKLAVFQAASRQPEPALRSMERALAAEPDCTPLLESAADLFEKTGHPERAAAIFETLVRTDPRRRIEYLKRLAELRKELGQIDRAIETARLLVSAGSQANLRYYAEMLVAAARIDEAVETLRRAVRLGDSDKTSHSMLANLLYDTGATGEAFELLWQMYEKSGGFREKLASVSQMATYYRQSGRFDELVDRLRYLPDGNGSRHETAFFTAQAYLSASDPAEARHILETRISDPGSPEQARWLFAQLSSLAESAGDLSEAIEYQEELCRRSDSVGESERLLMLYRKHGDDEAATNVLFDGILARGDLRERLAAVDDLLAHADYRTAFDIVSRLDEQHPEHWEILYRKLMAEFWLGNLDAASQTALRIPELADAVPKTEAGKIEYVPNSFWRYENRAVEFQISDADRLNPLQRHWAHSGILQFETIFRDRLRLHGGGSADAGTANPGRPQFVPDNSGDALFGVRTWQLRIALQRDFVDTETSPTFSHTKSVLAEFRKARQEYDTGYLEERLRIEYFLEQARIVAETYRNRFFETNFTALFLAGISNDVDPKDDEERKRKLAQGGRDLRTRLERELAFRGDSNWYSFASRHVFYELELDDAVRLFGKVDLPELYRKTAWEIEILDRFTKKEIVETEKIVVDRLGEIRRRNETIRHWSDSDKTGLFDFLFRNFEYDATATNDVAGHSLFVTLLRKNGFSERVSRAENILQRQLRAMPPLEAAILKTEIDVYADPLAELVADDRFPMARFLRACRHDPSMAIVFRPVRRSADEEKDVFGEILKTMQWLENRPDPTSSKRRLAVLANDLDAVVDIVLEQPGRDESSLRFGNDNNREGIRDFCERMFSTHFLFQSPGLLEMLHPNGQAALPGGGSVKRASFNVTPEYVSRIDFVEKEIYRTLDAYFQLMNRLDVGATYSKRTEEKIPPLREYLTFFERWQGNRLPESAMTVEESPRLLFMSFYFLESVDGFLRSGRAVPGVAKPFGNYLERYEKYLNAKRDRGTPVEKESVAKFQRWLDDTVRAADRTPKSAKEYRLQLEAEKKALSEQGGSLPASKMLLLAVYNRWDGNPGKAVEYLDAVPFSAVDDLRLREFLVLKLFLDKPDGNISKERMETGVQKLLGFQLRESELATLYETLVALNRDKQAATVRDRLLYVAANLNTQYKLLDILNRNENVGEDVKAVRFAFRVLTGPAIRSAMIGRSSFAPEARNLALQILEKADKLDEYVEQVEKQWDAAPGDPAAALSLADLYFRQGRQDEAMEIVAEIEKMVATRKITSQDYENLLRRGGLRRRIADLKQRTETEEAADRLKDFEKTPEKLFENLPVQVLVYERAHLVPNLIEVLKENRPEVLLTPLIGVMRHVENWLDNFYSREAARSLLEYVWKMDGVNEKQKRELRLKLLESFSYKTGREECLPMFREMVFDLLETENETTIFTPTHFGEDRVYSIGATFLDLVEKLGKLYEISRRFTDRLEAEDDPSPATMILAAAAELRRRGDENVLEFVTKLRKKAKTDDRTRTVFEAARPMLARELADSGKPEGVEMARELYREELERKEKNPMLETTIRKVLEKLENQKNEPDAQR